mmetsp:Transcript_13016/g.39113  ORF Transcript_13016/g.39113 Transcript_13016/m.39113 type:complete len:450 (-) Transcript_13016:572-1921(-)
MQRLERHRHAASVEAHLLSGEGPAQFPQCTEEVAAVEQLGQHVHVLRGLQGFDQVHHERMVELCQHLALIHELRREHTSHLVDALQGVLHPSPGVLHQPHHAVRPLPQDLHLSEVLQSDVGVMEHDSVHQLLLQPPLHDLLEGAPLDRPDVSGVAQNLHRGHPRLVEEEGALAEVGALAEGPHALALHEDAQLAPSHDVEGVALLALPDDEGPPGILLHHQGLDEGVGLPLRQVLEDVDLAQGLHPPGVVQRRARALDAGDAQVPESCGQAICREECEAAALVAGGELAEVLDAEALRLGLLVHEAAEELCGHGATVPDPLLLQLPRGALHQRDVAEPLPPLQHPGTQVRELGETCQGLAVDDDPKLHHVNVRVGAVRLEPHLLHQRELLHGGEAGKDGGVLQGRQEQVPLQQAGAQVLAQGGLQLAVGHAEQLTRSDCSHRGTARFIV